MVSKYFFIACALFFITQQSVANESSSLNKEFVKDGISDTMIRERSLLHVLRKLKYPQAEAYEEIRDRKIENKEAKERMPGYEAVQNIYEVSIKPGAEIPSIPISYQAPSLMEIIDVNGNPWPKTEVLNNSKAGFNIKETKSEQPNALIVETTRISGFDYLQIRLEGMNAWIKVKLVANSGLADINPTLKVMDIGPHKIDEQHSSTKTHFIETPNFDGNEIMQNLLYGLPIHPNSKKLTSNFNEIEAHKLGKYLYIRMPYDLEWPPATRYVGPLGYKAYRTIDTPIINITDKNGQFVKVTLTDMPEMKKELLRSGY